MLLENSVAKSVESRGHLTDLDSGRRMMASNDPPRPLTLFCWILGVSDHPFSVDIEDTRTVDHLKKAILKEKPAAFANVDPDQLTVWKVRGFSLSIDLADYSTL
jgi:hypothetical protein